MEKKNVNRFRGNLNRRMSPAQKSARYGIMSRSGFLKGLGVTGAGAGAAALGMSGVARAQIVPTGPDSCEVHPTGNPDPNFANHPLAGVIPPVPAGTKCTEDLFNVQGATLAFNNVLLKSGFFDFGDDAVYLIENVSLTGEGDHATTILNGITPFFILAPVNTTIENLKFDYSIGSAIFAVASSGATIRNNVITNTVPGFPADILDPAFAGLFYGIGIYFMGEVANMTGTIRIENNDIDMLYPSDFSIGMAFWLLNADLQITSNTVRKFAWNGMLILDNLGSTTITENNVVGPFVGEIWPVPTCIEVGSGSLIPGNEYGSYLILQNKMTVGHFLQTGIAVIDTTIGGVVTKNRIIMNGGLSGIDIWGWKDHYIGQNDIRGFGTFAMDIMPYTNYSMMLPNFVVENINFTGNHPNLFTPAVAHLYLGGRAINNTLEGYSGKVVDEPDYDPDVYKDSECSVNPNDPDRIYDGCGSAEWDSSGAPYYWPVREVMVEPNALWDPTIGDCVDKTFVVPDDCNNKSLKNNRITGYTPMDGGATIGPEVSDAMHRKRELMKNLRNISLQM